MVRCATHCSTIFSFRANEDQLACDNSQLTRSEIDFLSDAYDAVHNVPGPDHVGPSVPGIPVDSLFLYLGTMLNVS